MKTKLTKSEEKLYSSCCGTCRICFDEGGCRLEKKLKKMRKIKV